MFDPFELIFVYGVRWGPNFILCVWNVVFSVPFVEKIVLFPLNGLGPCVGDQLILCVQVYFWLSVLFHCFVCLSLCQFLTIGYCGFVVRLVEKAMAPHSSTLAWKISWTEEPGRLQSMGSLRVEQDWATSLSLSCTGEGNGNPLQCSCLENPRDGGAWWAAVYGVAQSRTWLKRLSSSSSSSKTWNQEMWGQICKGLHVVYMSA